MTAHSTIDGPMVRAVGLLLLMAALCTPVAVAAPADTAPVWRSDSLRPADTWNTLSLDVNVTRRRIAKSGEAGGLPSPSVAYRIERSSATGPWKTVVTVLGVDRVPAYSLSGTLVPGRPFPVSRIEDDEDGTPVRAFDARGRLLSPSVPTVGALSGASTLPRSSGREWLDAFVATAARRSKRLQEFERQFGKGAKAGALTRFLRRDLDSSQEVLVDPRNVVPTESKDTRSGRLASRRTFTYAPAPDAAVVRTFVHAETLVSAETGDRAVVDTAFSNVRLEMRR